MNCNVEFHNQSKIFLSGQEVKGVVIIENDKPRKISDILLVIDGNARTSWTETGADETSTYSYGATQQLIFSAIPLIQNKGGNKTRSNTQHFKNNEIILAVTLNPGNHKFNFNFLLDPMLPSSFDKGDGKIIYAVVIEIKTSETFSFNKKFQFKFDVISHVDLNLQKPEYRAPLKAEISKSFFMSSKVCSITAQIPHQAFAAGQDLPLYLFINNESKLEITSIISTLSRKYTFKCDKTRTKSDREVLLESIHAGLMPRSTHSATYSFKIPSSLIPTIDYSNCKYIDVVYELEVTAKVGGMHRSPKIYLPLYLASVPYKQL